MNSDREKLIELIETSRITQSENGVCINGSGYMADYLLKNGVTFAKDTDVPGKLVSEAISYFKYGVTHDIFKEPVTTYAKLAVAALENLFSQPTKEG